MKRRRRWREGREGTEGRGEERKSSSDTKAEIQKEGPPPKKKCFSGHESFTDVNIERISVHLCARSNQFSASDAMNVSFEVEDFFTTALGGSSPHVNSQRGTALEHLTWHEFHEVKSSFQVQKHGISV